MHYALNHPAEEIFDFAVAFDPVIPIDRKIAVTQFIDQDRDLLRRVLKVIVHYDYIPPVAMMKAAECCVVLTKIAGEMDYFHSSVLRTEVFHDTPAAVMTAVINKN